MAETSERAKRFVRDSGGPTSALITHCVVTSGIRRPDLEAAVPVAIDAIHEIRDADGSMHQAGAYAAMLVLEAVKEASSP